VEFGPERHITFSRFLPSKEVRVRKIRDFTPALKLRKPFFDVLLTVRLSIILVSDQLNAQILVL